MRTRSPEKQTTPLQPAAKASEPGARNATNQPEKQETNRQLNWNMGFTEVRNPSTLKGTSRSSKRNSQAKLKKGSLTDRKEKGT